MHPASIAWSDSFPENKPERQYAGRGQGAAGTASRDVLKEPQARLTTDERGHING
jgi:hypothetical protein